MIKGKTNINQTKEGVKAFFEKVGALTKKQWLTIYCVTFAVIGAAYAYFVLVPKQTELKKEHAVYQRQVGKLSIYQKRASQIQTYERLMARKTAEFNLAMEALPDKRELPSLLTGISKAGSDAGLEFHLFQPGNEVDKVFFKEIPVSIKVEGRYHQITDFFFQLTRLNRIVNIHNVDVKSKKGGSLLEMSCQAVTYMFVEKNESTDKNNPKKK